MHKMILHFVEALSPYLVDKSFRDEALGDLWEANHRLENQGISAFRRNFIILRRFIRICQSSLLLQVEEVRKVIVFQIDRKFIHANIDPTAIDLVEEMAVLNPDSFTLLKQYCDFRFLEKQTTSFSQWGAIQREKARYFDMAECQLAGWIPQVDRVIERCQSSVNGPGDCEAIVNSLSLSHLIQRLENHPPDQINVQTFLRLVQTVYLSREFIQRYVSFSQTSFTRKLVIRTWSLCIYVISWEPGQISCMHHHGNALDAIRVIEGEMSHWHLAPEDWEKEIPFEGLDDTDPYSGKPDTYHAGDIVTVDRRHGHQIANLSEQRLITLHFRFGQPPEDEHWRSTADGLMCVWNQVDRIVFVCNQQGQQLPMC